MTTQRIKILAPVLFWVFYFLVHVIRNIHQIANDSFFALFSTIKIIYPLDALTFILFYTYFAPRFFKKHKTNFNIVLGILFIVVFAFVWVAVYYFWQTKDFNDLKLIYFSSYGHSIMFAIYGILVRISIEWFEKREKQIELEKQNIKTELALLRAQINPHFLFNTLNNINSFAQSNSEKTSYAIIKLSEIMRYMLYEANAEKVFLDKEVQYIKNFIQLQKLRYKNPNFIDLQVSGNTSNILIPPMLFIPFVENVFKHGKKTEYEKIEIKIGIDSNEITFYCKNAKRELNETEKKGGAGIGISNIKRRLELLFHNNYKLEISETQYFFIVNLRIKDYEN